jgi:hypothetical protein
MQNNHINSQKYLSFCPECGAPWQVGLTCADCFHQMLYWENENPLLGAVHHLMVLAYHLQHPSLYSPEGLAYSLQLLADFLKHDLTPEQARKQNRFVVSSENRRWKIHAGPYVHACYAHPVSWQMTSRDVVSAGSDQYIRNVQNWSYSILADMRSSGNL